MEVREVDRSSKRMKVEGTKERSRMKDKEVHRY